jgi:predicted alpha/beta hydrolase family esterase
VASKLLDAIVKLDLLNERLIFVAHSFGGIVVSKVMNELRVY